MELYLFLALLLIYILTAFMVKKVILHKIWTLAFIGFCRYGGFNCFYPCQRTGCHDVGQ